MTPAERSRRARRLANAGFVAMPVGWVPQEVADRATAEIEHHKAAAEAAAAADLPMGRPPKSKD